MYTRRFRGHDIQIPKDYRGTAFDEKDEEFEKNILAEDEDIIESVNRPSPSYEENRDRDISTNTYNPSEDDGYTPPREAKCEDEKETSSGLLSHLGLGDMEFSDILLLLLAVLLMKEKSEDTELPILLLLLLLS